MRKLALIVMMAFFLLGNSDFCYAEKQANQDAPSPRKSYGVALAISFVAPGGGTIYAGNKTRGRIELGCTALAFGLMLSAGPQESWQGFAGVTLFLSTWMVSMVDAPIAVWQYNKEQSAAALLAPSKQLAVTPPKRNFHIPLYSLRF
ncbi:hypothetical protein ACFL5K_03890 [Gemmatimonadota bacterium]